MPLPSRFVSLAAAAILACAAGGYANPPARSKLLSNQIIAPMCLSSAPGDARHIFVCERAGAIRVLDKDTGARSPEPFLDITPLVSVEQDNGLLGLAFDPAYATSGFFYVNYRTPDGYAMLARYHATPGSLVADADSAFTIWRYPRPLGHNGGWIAISPTNGLLYISSGDGDLGGTYDLANRAQTIVNQRMGKILRIDPSSDDFPGDPDRNYHIPPANPFAEGPGDPEIWSYGVRNPWRCSFDRMTGDLFIGDVGMDNWEEIDFEPATSSGGRNYGWPCMEGTHCTGSSLCSCEDPSLTGPIYDYPHPLGGSVIGGYVYRGAAIPEFQGLYIFGDFLRPKIWSFRFDEVEGLTEFQDRSAEFTPPGTTFPIRWISSFGEDAEGELYICDVFGNNIYKIVPYPCLPVVDVNPAPQDRSERATIVFTVLGAGADPLTFRWRKNGLDLEEGGRLNGTDTATLTISHAQVSDAGDYDVVLTSPCGSTASSVAHLNVQTCQSADTNGSGTVTIQDLFDFLALWFAGGPGADFNQSGQVTVQDIFDYLSAWFLGCP